MIARKLLPLAVLALIPAVALAQVDDPYLWLEDIEGSRALAQMKTWNAETDALLTKDTRFESDRARARAILDDKDQIAMPGKVMGDRITNFWRDAQNPRGLWRSASLADYRAGRPQWTTIIDVDALGKREGKSWVWHGANCLEPAYTRCLISLSPGGTDADVVREFDLTTGKFVTTNGFVLPEAKSEVTWVDRDTLLVATDWGQGALTTSGYPRVAKLWKRGTALASATSVMSADAKSVGLNVISAVDATDRYPILSLSKSYWDSDYFLVAQDGKVRPIPLPEGATYEDVIAGRLIAKLQRPYKRLPEGAVVSYAIADIRAGLKTEPQLVIAPTRTQAIEEIDATDGVLWVKLLDNVSGKLIALTPNKVGGARGGWTQRVVPLAANSTIHIAGGDGKSDLAFATVEGMLTPPTLYAVPARDRPTVVHSLPAKFDAKQFAVVQKFARSRDGTRVPYFLVTKKGTTGAVPALIHAYGGFRNAQTPTYLTGQPYRAGPLGLFWVEQGNAYVLANIRGGGEYGPRWHREALREKRQNSFDDLHAVAEDLVRTGVSAKGKIAISGRSNGGVLVGAAMNQRPDLYGAVISGSPLHDMKRYSHLSAGASWMDEYGNPDVPADWAFMSQYSPYQNLKPGVKYPALFEYLSTKDDRVHPGHARKFTARLKEYGQTVYYHEYLEGGHSVGADNAEDANRAALLDAFLRRELMGVR